MKFKTPFIANVAAILAAFLIGCSSTPESRKSADSTAKANGEAAPRREQKGGAQLWAERCSQCHFARDPGAFSPEQWEIIMFHMRIRANLTALETESILEFIKSAN